MTSTKNDVTQLLIAWSKGDQSARDQLMPLVYDELHHLAHRHIRNERKGHTLQTSALVNEAFIKLVDWSHANVQNRTHFFSIAAQVMRQILVDYARSRRYAKRGGDARQVTLEEDLVVSDQRSAEVVALDDALNELAREDERKAKVVELRFFAGLSIEETAAVLAVSPGTVMRDWTLAKAWLQRAMSLK